MWQGRSRSYISPMARTFCCLAVPTLRTAVIAVVAIAAGLANAQFWPQVVIEAPNGTSSGSRFGSAMAMEGDWLLIGAPSMDDGAPGTGAAFLFNRYEGGENAWGFVKKLEPPALQAGSAFGSAVELSDGRAFVSAPGEPWTVLPVGAVHVFEQDLGGTDQWEHRQRIMPANVQAGMEFGATFSVRNDLLVVNSPRYDEDPTDQQLVGAGLIIGFIRESSGLYSERRSVRGDSLMPTCAYRPCAGERTALVNGVVMFAGRNGLYYLESGILQEQSSGPVQASPVLLANDFGIPPDPVWYTGIAAADGVVVTCMRTTGFVHPRAVSFAEVDAQDGPHQEGVMHPDSNTFLDWWLDGGWGEAMDMHGDVVAVGAFGHPTFTPLGHVDVYVRDEGVAERWRFLQRISPSDPATGDMFGYSVAVHGDVVAAGAPGAGYDNAGRAYVFTDPTVGVEEGYREHNLVVHPNPARCGQGHVRIRFPGGNAGRTVLLHAQDGAVMGLYPVQDGVLPIDALVPGMYLARSQGTSACARFIILP